MASDRVIWRRALAPFGVSENTSARQIPLSNTQRIVCVCVCARILDTMLGHFDHAIPDLYTYPGHFKDFFTCRTYRNCFFNLLLLDFFFRNSFLLVFLVLNNDWNFILGWTVSKNTEKIQWMQIYIPDHRDLGKVQVVPWEKCLDSWL